jgi:hypothetical protein
VSSLLVAPFWTGKRARAKSRVVKCIVTCGRDFTFSVSLPCTRCRSQHVLAVKRGCTGGAQCIRRSEYLVSLTLPNHNTRSFAHCNCYALSSPNTLKQMLSKRVLYAKVQPNAVSYGL